MGRVVWIWVAVVCGCAEETGLQPIDPGPADGFDPSDDNAPAPDTTDDTLVSEVMLDEEICTTESVLGLANQLVREIECMRPGTFSRIDSIPRINLGVAAIPFLQTPVRDALRATIEAVPSEVMYINSTVRSLPQQLLLRHWAENRRCRVSRAAPVDRSNHLSGNAIDQGTLDDGNVVALGIWQAALEDNSFVWYGSADSVHFDYGGPGVLDLRRASVLAFQRLWNRAHPEDMISADGSYGPQTEMRLLNSPARGFDIPEACFSVEVNANCVAGAACEEESTRCQTATRRCNCQLGVYQCEDVACPAQITAGTSCDVGPFTCRPDPQDTGFRCTQPENVWVRCVNEAVPGTSHCPADVPAIGSPCCVYPNGTAAPRCQYPEGLVECYGGHWSVVME